MGMYSIATLHTDSNCNTAPVTTYQYKNGFCMDTTNTGLSTMSTTCVADTVTFSAYSMANCGGVATTTSLSTGTCLSYGTGYYIYLSCESNARSLAGSPSYSQWNSLNCAAGTLNYSVSAGTTGCVAMIVGGANTGLDAQVYCNSTGVTANLYCTDCATTTCGITSSFSTAFCLNGYQYLCAGVHSVPSAILVLAAMFLVKMFVKEY